jgi:hypothetical protein
MPQKHGYHGRFVGGGSSGGSGGSGKLGASATSNGISGAMVSRSTAKTRAEDRSFAHGQALAENAKRMAPKVATATDGAIHGKAKGLGYQTPGSKPMDRSKRSAGRQASRAAAIDRQATKVGKAGGNSTRIHNVSDAIVLRTSGLAPKRGGYIKASTIKKASAGHKASRGVKRVSGKKIKG